MATATVVQIPQYRHRPVVELAIFVDGSFVKKYEELGFDIDQYIQKLVDIMRKFLGHLL